MKYSFLLNLGFSMKREALHFSGELLADNKYRYKTERP
jgi:hypothetical protein